MDFEMGEAACRLDEEPLVLIERFHGHVGPYVVMGYRSGRFARERLGVSAFRMRAQVCAGHRPPMSCFVDGVQLGSGCTMGKGNIEMLPDELVEARFISEDGRQLAVRVRREVLERLGGRMDETDLAKVSSEIAAMPLGELFEVSEG